MDARSQKKSMFFVVLAIVTVAGGFAVGQDGGGGGEEDTIIWSYTWDAPTTGSPVAHYTVQVVVDQGDTLTFDRVAGTQFNLPVSMGTEYEVRVAGVDALDRRGPYTLYTLRETVELNFPARP